MEQPHKGAHKESTMATGELRYLAGTAGGAPLQTGLYKGRPHLIVPVVALMEGVIHAVNAPSAEYVPLSELSHAPQGWDGRPVVPGHPSVGSAKVSANSPTVLASSKFGTVFNTRMSLGKLLMDAWLDPERAKAMGGDAAKVVERLNAGAQVEVSVGAFVTAEPAEGEYNGKRYAAKWRGIIPDHLAMLPETTKGACSIEMGCGAPRSAERAEGEGELRVADEGDESARAVEDDMDEPVTDNEVRAAALSHADLRERLNDAIASVTPGFCCVESVSTDDTCIYSVGDVSRPYAMGPEPAVVGPPTLYRRSFTLSADDSVELADDAVEVEPVMTYEPVERDAADAEERSAAGMPFGVAIKAVTKDLSSADKAQVTAYFDGDKAKADYDALSKEAKAAVDKARAMMKTAEAAEDGELRDAWDESQHPRDKDGKFSGDGDGGVSSVGSGDQKSSLISGTKGHSTVGRVSDLTGKLAGKWEARHTPMFHGKVTLTHHDTRDEAVAKAKEMSGYNDPPKTDPFSARGRAIRRAESASRYCRFIPQSERDRLDASSFAGPHQSYPIRVPADVKSAAALVGKAADPAEVKARIIAIAKRKGEEFVAQLPESWTTKAEPKATEGKVMCTCPDCTMRAAWDESQHPRDDAGKFSGGGDGGGGGRDGDGAATSVSGKVGSNAKTGVPGAKTKGGLVRTVRVWPESERGEVSPAGQANNLFNPKIPEGLDKMSPEQQKAALKDIQMDVTEGTDRLRDVSVDLHPNGSVVISGANRDGTHSAMAWNPTDHTKTSRAIKDVVRDRGLVKAPRSSPAKGEPGYDADTQLNGVSAAYAVTNPGGGVSKYYHTPEIAKFHADRMTKETGGKLKYGTKHYPRTLETHTPDACACADCAGAVRAAEDNENVDPVATSGDIAAQPAAACGNEGVPSAMTVEQRAETIRALTESKHSGFTADDVAMLEAAPCARLESFKVAADARQQEAETRIAAAKRVPTEEEFMAMAPASLKSLIARQQRQETEHKTELVSALKTAQEEYGEAELAGMEIEQLERLARVAQLPQVSFAGRGLPRAAEKGDDVYANPPDPYALAIAAQRK